MGPRFLFVNTGVRTSSQTYPERGGIISVYGVFVDD